MPVRILVTGGTFDKEYDEITGELYFKETHMKEILELGRSQLEVKIQTLMLIDSLKMTKQDRAIILENCKSTKENQIVITHGTDTMTKTAKILAGANLKKTIVLTGKMSDLLAQWNLKIIEKVKNKHKIEKSKNKRKN